MRARIFMLASEERFLPHLSIFQTALTSLAVAFNHSFVMKQVVNKDPLPSELSAIQESDAALLAGSDDFIITLMNKSGCFAALHSYDLPNNLEGLSRLKSGQLSHCAVIWPLHPTEAQVGKAAVEAYRYAAEARLKLKLIPPEENSAIWENAATKAAMYSAQEAPLIAKAGEAIIQQLSGREKGNILLTSYKDAQLLIQLFDWLGGVENLGFTVYLGDTKRVNVLTPGISQRLGVFSTLYATADMVKYSLHLEKEANCLKTAIDNVLTSGWRTDDMEQGEKNIPEQEVLRLIEEQIALAGELFEH